MVARRYASLTPTISSSGVSTRYNPGADSNRVRKSGAGGGPGAGSAGAGSIFALDGDDRCGQRREPRAAAGRIRSPHRHARGRGRRCRGKRRSARTSQVGNHSIGRVMPCLSMALRPRTARVNPRRIRSRPARDRTN
jgi:hypothetical protein